MKKTITDLSGYAEATTQRLDLLVQEIKDNAIQNLELIENVVRRQNNIVDFLNNITLDSMRLNHMISNLVIHYTNFLTGIQILNAGKLPMYILPKEELDRILKSIQYDLSESEQGKQFKIIHMRSDFYYRKGAFVFTRDEENLYITLQIPITNIHFDFLLYTVTYHSLTMHDDTKHTLELEDKVYGMAISTSGELYVEMTEYEVKTVNSYDHSLQRRLFRTSGQESCLMAIYQDNKQLVKSSCRYVIAMHEMRPKITHLYGNSYLFMNVSEVKYQCGGQEISQKGCISCIITLKSQCSIRVASYYLPETLTGKFENEENMKYTTSLPLLIQFFTNESLKDIKGYTQYVEAPKLDLPKFSFYESHLARTFAEDDKKRVNLQKAVESVKNDKVIVNGLSEAIVLGKILPNSNFWGSGPGIITTITAVVGVLSILANLYLLNKVRYLIIAVGVLKATVLKTNAEVLNLNYGKLENGENQNEVMQFDLPEMREVHLHYLTIMMLLAMITVTVGIAYKLWCKRVLLHFTFTLEIVSHSKYYYVDIVDLYGAEEDYVNTAEEYIKNVKIRGWLRPTLQFEWKNLRLTDHVTQTVIIIPNRIKLSWIKGRQLRKVLENNFQIHPIFQRQGKLKRITIQNNNIESIKARTSRIEEEWSGMTA